MKIRQLIKELEKFTGQEKDPDVYVKIRPNSGDYQPISDLACINIEGDRVLLSTVPSAISDAGEPEFDQVLNTIRELDEDLIDEMLGKCALSEVGSEKPSDPWEFIDRIGSTKEEIQRKSGIDSQKLQSVLIHLHSMGMISKRENGRYYVEE